jgi:outer membrane protein assembly factor BamD (BamD/ComL family)
MSENIPIMPEMKFKDVRTRQENPEILKKDSGEKIHLDELDKNQSYQLTVKYSKTFINTYPQSQTFKEIKYIIDSLSIKRNVEYIVTPIEILS